MDIGRIRLVLGQPHIRSCDAVRCPVATSPNLIQKEYRDDRIRDLPRAQPPSGPRPRRRRSTLRYWRHLGWGPPSFKVYRHVRYWRADLILWLTEQTNRPQHDWADLDISRSRRILKTAREE